MSKYIDISLTIDPRMPVWPGDAAVSFEPVSSITSGEVANTTRFIFGSHTGTHLDPPRHFLARGKTVEELDLDALIGPCVVLDLTHLDRHVSAADLEAAGVPEGCQRVLVKTRNSRLWDNPLHEFERDFLAIEPDAAQWLVDKGVRLVGVDYLSVEKFHSDGHHTHYTLLKAGVIALEGLDLRQAEAGKYELICLPIKFKNGDGAPVRAVLRKG